MLRRFLILFSISFCLAAAGCVLNPATGEKQFMLFTPEQRVELGSKLAPEFEKQSGGRIEDPQLQNYINRVGQKIANCTGAGEMEFHYTAVNDSSVNAFAVPGGYVFITKGMLKKLKSEAQLAGVFGHETAHIMACGATEAMSRQMGVEILMSLIVSDETPETVLQISQLVWNLNQLRYSRKDETEADLRGLDYMVKAGYNPYAMAETMDMLMAESKSEPIEFLSTHPNSENRRELLVETIQQRYYNLTQMKISAEDYRQNVLGRLE